MLLQKTFGVSDLADLCDGLGTQYWRFQSQDVSYYSLEVLSISLLEAWQISQCILRWTSMKRPMFSSFASSQEQQQVSADTYYLKMSLCLGLPSSANPCFSYSNLNSHSFTIPITFLLQVCLSIPTYIWPQNSPIASMSELATYLQDCRSFLVWESCQPIGSIVTLAIIADFSLLYLSIMSPSVFVDARIFSAIYSNLLYASAYVNSYIRVKFKLMSSLNKLTPEKQYHNQNPKIPTFLFLHICQFVYSNRYK